MKEAQNRSSSKMEVLAKEMEDLRRENAKLRTDNEANLRRKAELNEEVHSLINDLSEARKLLKRKELENGE